MDSQKRIHLSVWLGLTLMLGSAPAFAWWDTVVGTVRPVPLVQEIAAEKCSGPPASAIVTDEQANGGRGGQTVKLTPGGPGLTTEINVKPGLSAIFTDRKS